MLLITQFSYCCFNVCAYNGFKYTVRPTVPGVPPKKNGTQVNGYNFVTVDLKYLKFCRYKVKILND